MTAMERNSTDNPCAIRSVKESHTHLYCDCATLGAELHHHWCGDCPRKAVPASVLATQMKFPWPPGPPSFLDWPPQTPSSERTLGTSPPGAQRAQRPLECK